MIHSMDDVTDRTLAAEKLFQVLKPKSGGWLHCKFKSSLFFALILSLQIFHTAELYVVAQITFMVGLEYRIDLLHSVKCIKV